VEDVSEECSFNPPIQWGATHKGRRDIHLVVVVVVEGEEEGGRGGEVMMIINIRRGKRF